MSPAAPQPCPPPDGEVLERLGALVTRLQEREVTVAVAESLTGGAVLDALVSVPGVSACLRGGVVAYATDVKRDVLGVDAGLLERHGAVHPDVAVAMARGVRALLGATYGLATTGVAGPDPQDGRPVGTVHVAVVGPAGPTVRSRTGEGPPSPPAGDVAQEVTVPSRAAVRARARDDVLDLLGLVLATEAEPGHDRREHRDVAPR